MEYTSHTEAPRHMHFWTGVSTIAGALQRKVWIDQRYFRWYPNLYVVLVAPPGVVSKSTTAGLGMNLLRKVPDVKFGPEIATWPALVDSFEKAKMEVPIPYDSGLFYPMSCLTLESSEFGVLLDPQDKGMVDLLVSLWDGKEGKMEKVTKTSGTNYVENPWINIIACTTPSWIAGNFPEYMIGGGFTSRTLFVYADKKEKFIAYPYKHTPAHFEEMQAKLVEDLCHIHTRVRGEYKLSANAEAWGEAWYHKHYSIKPDHLDDERFGGYLARKQTMIHKVGMIVAASSGDDLVLEPDHLALADTMISDLEPDLQFVFSKIGRSTASIYTERLVAFVHSRGRVAYSEAYRYVHSFFSSMRDYEDILLGCLRAGYIRLEDSGKTLVAGEPLPQATNGKIRG